MAKLNRRDFLKGSTALTTLASFGLLGMDFKDREGPIRVALIGTGWYGKSDLFRLIQVADVDVVGLCDPDRNMLEGAAKLVAERQSSGKTPPLYENYKELLEKEKPEFVLIGSPDHWHALQAIDAIKSGAHVYLQKPISVDVIEGEAILAAARKYNRTVQIGTQRKSTPHLIDAKKEIIDSGKLGNISHVEICCYYHMRANGNPGLEPVPDFLNYDLWTGPAPLRPYDGLPHRRWWRTFVEYGNGITGDMCVHMLDTVRWMLKLGWPTQITSTGGIYVQKDGKSNISDTQTAIFEYPELNVVWQHRTWGNPVDPEYPWAFKIFGDKGVLAGSTMQADFTPYEDNGEPIHYDCFFEREKYPEDLTEVDIELNAAPATRLHMKDWLAAVENKSRPIADVEDGHISTAACILANISMDLGGRVIKYDPKSRTILGDPEATAMLKRPYREGYVHPDPDTV